MEIISSFGGYLSSIVVPKKESTPYSQMNIDQIVFTMTWHELVDSYMSDEVKRRKELSKKCDEEVKTHEDMILWLRNRKRNIQDLRITYKFSVGEK